MENNVSTSDVNSIRCILSYWGRHCDLSNISIQHITTETIENVIRGFMRHGLCDKIAENVLHSKAIEHADISKLCEMIPSVLQSDPPFIRISFQSDRKLFIFGSICGDLDSLLSLFGCARDLPEMDIIDKIMRFNDIYLFLGSYSCRGPKSIECLCLLYSLKIMFPQNIFLLRGWYDDACIARIYGLYDDFKRIYNVSSGILLWKSMIKTFEFLPVCAVIEDTLFCVHSGISPEFMKQDDLEVAVNSKIKIPSVIPDSGMLYDFVNSRPEDGIKGWGDFGGRDNYYCFGPDIVDSFLEKYGWDTIIRSHEVVEEGYEFMFSRQIVTLFSSVNYISEWHNDGAMIVVEHGGDDDPSLMVSFKVIKWQTVKELAQI